MTIQLSKSQVITLDLSKGKNGTIEKLFFGTKWGKIGARTEKQKIGGILGFGGKTTLVEVGGQSVDLDASVLYLDSNGLLIDKCYFGKKNISGACHSGDDRSGGIGENDNETIVIDPNNVPSNVNSIVLILNSFSGQTLDRIPFTSIRVYEGLQNKPEKEHCSFKIDNSTEFKGKMSMVLGKMYRQGNGWDFKAIGDIYAHRYIDGLVSEMYKYK